MPVAGRPRAANIQSWNPQAAATARVHLLGRGGMRSRLLALVALCGITALAPFLGARAASDSPPPPQRNPAAMSAETGTSPPLPERNPLRTKGSIAAPEKPPPPPPPGEMPTVPWTEAEIEAAKAKCKELLTGDPLDYATAVQQVIHDVDPDQPIRQVRPMSDVVDLTVADRQQHTMLLVVFGGLALLIASIGLYGLLSQLVSARSREIGLRIALGATWRTVVTMVMSRGIALTAAGMLLGAGIAWAVTRTLQTLLYGVGAADPLTFAAVAGLLSAVTLAACAVPAVRAARVDPMVVLREQ